MFEDFHFFSCENNPAPKYRQLATALERHLEKAHYPAGSKLPPDRELSRLLGISSMTLSRSLNELVSRGLLERRVGAGTYLLDLHARPPLTHRFGVVSHEPISGDGGFVTSLFGQMQSLASQHQIDLIQFQRNPDGYEYTFREYHLDGLIVLSPSRQMLPALKKLSEDGMNLVQVGVYHPEISALSFGTDHHAAAQEAVRQLVAWGHRRIGILSRLNSADLTLLCGGEERLAGYRQGMWQAGLPVNPKWEISLDAYEFEKLQEAIDTLRQEDSLPSAFLLGNLGLIPLAYSVFREAGLEIPNDISLIAFDDGPICRQLSPALTVYSQSIELTARKSFDCLLARHDGHLPEPHPPIPYKFLERNSCRILK